MTTGSGARASGRPGLAGPVSERTGGTDAAFCAAAGARGGATAAADPAPAPDHLPNIRLSAFQPRSSGRLAASELLEDRLQQIRAGPLRLGLAGDGAGELDEDLGNFAGRLHLGDHLAVVGGRAEELGVEGQRVRDLRAERLGEFGGRDLGPLRQPELVQHDLRLAVVRPRLAEVVVKILAV